MNPKWTEYIFKDLCFKLYFSNNFSDFFIVDSRWLFICVKLAVVFKYILFLILTVKEQLHHRTVNWNWEWNKRDDSQRGQSHSHLALFLPRLLLYHKNNRTKIDRWFHTTFLFLSACRHPTGRWCITGCSSYSRNDGSFAKFLATETAGAPPPRFFHIQAWWPKMQVRSIEKWADCDIHSVHWKKERTIKISCRWSWPLFTCGIFDSVVFSTYSMFAACHARWVKYYKCALIPQPCVIVLHSFLFLESIWANMK